MTIPTPTTLTGYLGADREIRLTRPRTRTGTRYNPVAQCKDPYELTPPPREYARMSLATHHREGRRWITTWHQLVVWDVTRPDRFAARLGRKGDKVTVRGKPRTYRFTGNDGAPRTIHRFEVEAFYLWPDKKTRPRALRQRPRTRHLGTILGSFSPIQRNQGAFS